MCVLKAICGENYVDNLDLPEIISPWVFELRVITEISNIHLLKTFSNLANLKVGGVMLNSAIELPQLEKVTFQYQPSLDNLTPNCWSRTFPNLKSLRYFRDKTENLPSNNPNFCLPNSCEELTTSCDLLSNFEQNSRVTKLNVHDASKTRFQLSATTRVSSNLNRLELHFKESVEFEDYEHILRQLSNFLQTQPELQVISFETDSRKIILIDLTDEDWFAKCKNDAVFWTNFEVR